jgi:putative spermidine/putrescine transport system ATP-binding protein
MLVAGFTVPTEGSIAVDGADITAIPPERRNFGMVFQGYALFPHLTAEANVAFPLEVRGTPSAEVRRKVAATLELVQLSALAKRRPAQLSGGQQQRVALARALVFAPKLLLLDEPLSALDKKLRAELQAELKDIHQRVGTTFVNVTHDQEEALSMSNRIAVLRDGKVVQYGAPAELYERPASRFVADFFGTTNFLPTQVRDRTESGFVYEIAGSTFEHRQSTPPPPAGQSVLLSIRPDKVKLQPANTTGPRLSGTVRVATYVGRQFHVVVALGTLGRFNVTLPTAAADGLLEPGTPVALTWARDATVMVQPD